MRALIVDDSRAMRALIGKMLRELGWEVVEAGDGREALERVQGDREIRLVLVDWHMPVMDGVAFVRAVRGDPRFAALPLVMVTTESELSRMQAALDSGASEYLLKPFDKDAIRSKLEILGVAAE